MQIKSKRRSTEDQEETIAELETATKQCRMPKLRCNGGMWDQRSVLRCWSILGALEIRVPCRAIHSEKQLQGREKHSSKKYNNNTTNTNNNYTSSSSDNNNTMDIISCLDELHTMIDSDHHRGTHKWNNEPTSTLILFEYRRKSLLPTKISELLPHELVGK